MEQKSKNKFDSGTKANFKGNKGPPPGGGALKKQGDVKMLATCLVKSFRALHDFAKREE